MTFKPDTAPALKKDNSKDVSGPHKLESRKMEEIPILDQQTIQQVRDWSDAWLQDFYKTSEGGFVRFSMDYIQSFRMKLAKTVGEEESLQQFQYKPRFRLATKVFFEQLLNFVEIKTTDSKEKQNSQKFIRNITEIFFSFSPGLEESLSFEDKLLLTSIANRIPETQGFLGQKMVGEIVYDLNFGGDSSFIEKIAVGISQKSISEIIDMINQLETIGATAAGEMYDASKALEKIVKIIRTIRVNNKSPIVNYASGFCLERLRVETKDPSVGFVTYLGNKRHGRLEKDNTRQIELDHLLLAGQINPDIDIEDEILARVASDAVATMDHSHIPRYIANIDQEKLPEKQEISIIALRNIKETSRLRDTLSADEMERFFYFIQKRIISFSETIKEKEENTGDIWYRITKCLNPQDWQNFFDKLKKFNSFKEELNQQLYSGVRQSYQNKELWNSGIGRELILSMQPLNEKFKDIAKALVEYLEKLDQEISPKLQPVHFRPYKYLSDDPKINPFRQPQRDEFSLLLQHLHQPELRQKIEIDLGINLSEIPLRSQIHLLRFLSNQNTKGFDRLRNVLQQNSPFKNEFLRSFLITAEDSRFGSVVIGLVEVLSNQLELGIKVFQTYDQYIAQAEEVAKKVLIDLQKEFPSLSINENIIVQSLLTRAKDFMVELEVALKSNPEKAGTSVDNFIAELKKESPKEQIVRAQFKTVASLLDRDNIELKTFEQNQDLILGSSLKGTLRSLFFRTLSRMGKLSPVPEIHWRVDRSNEEYSRRLGVNLIEFLQQRAKGSSLKQILLEIGPGSGTAKAERNSLGLSENYQDIALSDKIYYPLSGVIEKLIDFSHLEQDGHATLTPQERKQLADFVYKTLIITEGQTSSDTFTYDEQNQARLVEDINNLRNIIGEQLSKRLKDVFEVPDTISAHHDGQVVYPNKIKTESWSPQLQAVKKLLENNSTQYMRSDWDQIDLYGLIDAFPANVMVGDLSQIEKLEPNQIDVELAVRSTVYKRGEEYVEFLQQLMEKLNKGGVAIDDSIRDNDGWYYRIAEVMKVKTKAGSDTEVLVVLGPGFPGEDKRQDRVPLSMIITKQGSSVELIRKNLLPGYEIIKLEDLASDQEYLTTLDDTGLTGEKITRQMEMVS